MPYYCTVPRCTSMAGKAKNVSFHQFPRDEELAKLWNKILKRGKPYTKYSKVCSLHFKPEDYTITSVGKNKGQWRTLRKDAIPSQNLPSDSPVPYQSHRNTGSWHADNPPSSIVDAQVHQQMAQAIYLQTMLAMQASGSIEGINSNSNSNDESQEAEEGHSSNDSQNHRSESPLNNETKTSYRCSECLKYFKDPDVFILHQRTHSKNNEKENLNTNSDETSNPTSETFHTNGEETLKSNPILANLLKSQGNSSLSIQNNVLSKEIENQITAAFKLSMQTYIRNLLLSQGMNDNSDKDLTEVESDCDKDLSETADSSKLAVEDNA